MIKTVAFDLGNVIVFFSFAKAIEQISTCTGLSPDQIQHLLIHQNLRDLYESGSINCNQLYGEFTRISPKTFTFQQLFHAISDIFTPNSTIFPIIEALKAKGTRLILLSNTSKAHIDYILPNYPILDLFDAKVLSFEVKASKPHPQIFQAALSAAQCEPHECFYVDDIPHYVDAARKHGIDAEVFTNTAALRHQLSVRGLL